MTRTGHRGAVREVGIAEDAVRAGEIVVTGRNPEHEAARERFRRLAIRLRGSVPDGAPAVWMVTSPMPGDGKTVVSVNLALALAEDRSREVLLVDADLRRPRVHRFFSGVPGRGLADLLREGEDPAPAVCREPESRLNVLFAGKPGSREIGTLPRSGARVAGLFRVLRERYGEVVVDTPPAGVLADAAYLAAHCDGVLVVVRSHRTPRAQLVEVLEELGPDRVAGIVLNGAVANFLDRSGYRYGYRQEPHRDEADEER